MSDEELRGIFAANLCNFLSLNGYNQADLARHMGVSTASTAKWCNGQTIPRIDKIQNICNWLVIEKDDLLSRKVAPTKNYYIDKDARELAEFLYKNPEYRVLFDATRKVKPEDINIIRVMIERMSDHG